MTLLATTTKVVMTPTFYYQGGLWTLRVRVQAYDAEGNKLCYWPGIIAHNTNDVLLQLQENPEDGLKGDWTMCTESSDEIIYTREL